jgi:hypothetical protein
MRARSRPRRKRIRRSPSAVSTSTTGRSFSKAGRITSTGPCTRPTTRDGNCTQPFVWRDAASQWCGFGVSTAQSLKGPWSAPTVLISNTTEDYAIDQPFEQACMGRDGTFALAEWGRVLRAAHVPPDVGQPEVDVVVQRPQQ